MNNTDPASRCQEAIALTGCGAPSRQLSVEGSPHIPEEALGPPGVPWRAGCGIRRVRVCLLRLHRRRWRQTMLYWSSALLSALAREHVQVRAVRSWAAVCDRP